MTDRPRNALTSLWGRGGPDPDTDTDAQLSMEALMGLEHTGILNGGQQGKRVQRVMTPPNILVAVREVWPEGIAFDPCGAPHSLVNADRWACPDPDSGADHPDGLAVPWPRRTFVNPPYDDLEPWLRQCADGTEVIALVPVRPHRRWWRDHVFAMADAMCWLDPIAFVRDVVPGDPPLPVFHDQVFPAALCGVYWGERVAAWSRAFEPLGGVCELSWAGQAIPGQLRLGFGGGR